MVNNGTDGFGDSVASWRHDTRDRRTAWQIVCGRDMYGKVAWVANAIGRQAEKRRESADPEEAEAEERATRGSDAERDSGNCRDATKRTPGVEL
jgi:hypothetical protein